MHAYSMDLRTRVLAACDAGQSNDAVAVTFQVSTAWIRRLKQRRRETGSCAPKVPQRSAAPSQMHAESLRQLVEQRPDATLQELREALGLKASIATICRLLQRLRLTVKKKWTGQRSGTVRMSRVSGRSGKR